MQRRAEEMGTPCDILGGKISAGPALVRASGFVSSTMEKEHFDGQAAWREALSSDEGRTRAVETANFDGQRLLAEAFSRELKPS